MLVRLPYLSHGFISVEVEEHPVLSKHVQKLIKISFPFDRMSFRVLSLGKEPSLLEKPRFPKFCIAQKRDDAAKNDNIKTEEKQGRKAQKQVALVSDTERKYIERPTHWSSVALQGLHKSHLSLSCSRRR